MDPLSDTIHPGIAAEDLPLVAEAVRRAERYGYTAGLSGDLVAGAIVEALREGRRDLYSLVKAGRRAGVRRD